MGGGAEAHALIIRFCRSDGLVLEVEVLQRVDGLVGVSPAAGGVVEALVGEEVLIGGVEGGLTVFVHFVAVDLNRGAGICGVIHQAIEGGIENVLYALIPENCVY